MNLYLIMRLPSALLLVAPLLLVGASPATTAQPQVPYTDGTTMATTAATMQSHRQEQQQAVGPLLCLPIIPKETSPQKVDSDDAANVIPLWIEQFILAPPLSLSGSHENFTAKTTAASCYWTQFVPSLLKTRLLCRGKQQQKNERHRRINRCVGLGGGSAFAGIDGDGYEVVTSAMKKKKKTSSTADATSNTNEAKEHPTEDRPQWDEGRRLLNLLSKVNGELKKLDSLSMSSSQSKLLSSSLSNISHSISEPSLQSAWCSSLLTCGMESDRYIVGAIESFDVMCEAVVAPLWAEVEEKLVTGLKKLLAAAKNENKTVAGKKTLLRDADGSSSPSSTFVSVMSDFIVSSASSSSRTFPTLHSIAESIELTLQLHKARKEALIEEDEEMAAKEAKATRRIVSKQKELEMKKRKEKVDQLRAKKSSFTFLKQKSAEGGEENLKESSASSSTLLFSL